MRSKPVGAGSPQRSESFSITFKGEFNSSLHHPSWYYTIGQLAKDEAAATMQQGALHVTPALSWFRTDAFGVRCTPDRWRITTHDAAARLRILQVALKTFETLLPEVQLREVGFRFVFALEVPHEQVVALLSRLMWNPMTVESRGEVAATLQNTVTTEAPRRRRVKLGSRLGEGRARLAVSFGYPLGQGRVFTLRQLSVAEDFELDYEEAVTYAEGLAYTLTGAAQGGKVEFNN